MNDNSAALGHVEHLCRSGLGRQICRCCVLVRAIGQRRHLRRHHCPPRLVQVTSRTPYARPPAAPNNRVLPRTQCGVKISHRFTHSADDLLRCHVLSGFLVTASAAPVVPSAVTKMDAGRLIEHRARHAAALYSLHNHVRLQKGIDESISIKPAAPRLLQNRPTHLVTEFV